MKPFTKNELVAVAVILLTTFSLTFYNLRISIRRSRDVQRRSDLGAISDALHKFQEGFGYFPESSEGKIKMCKADNFAEIVGRIKEQSEFDRNLYFEGLRSCVWGKDSFRDLLDEDFRAYLDIIPQDPKGVEGTSYYYLSNTNRLQLYSYLEGENDETGYNSGIFNRNLKCGDKICNFGKSSGDTPLEISIED